MLARRRHARRCRRLAAGCREEELRACLEAATALDVRDLPRTPALAVDLELTGLDPARDRIVAMGWVPIDRGRIRLGAARHIVTRAERSVGDSAAVHELLDREVAEGVAPEAALAELFEAATGRVWVFHHAPLDVAFLKAACEHWTGLRPPFALLDTMALERRRRERRNLPLRQGDLQLGALREEYHLPPYRAHNALTDALATAELLLAQLAHAGDGNLRGSLSYA